MRNLAPLPLRLMIGAGMVFHGFPKLFTTRGHTEFAGLLQNLAVPAAPSVAWLVAVLEFFGGIALILGLFTVPVAVLLIAHQAVAMTLVHMEAGFSFMNIVQTPAGPQFGMPGYEVNLLYVAALLSLAFSGAGAFSVDEDLRSIAARRRRGDLQTVITAEPERQPIRTDL
jgi:putative oxidoreductase